MNPHLDADPLAHFNDSSISQQVLLTSFEKEHQHQMQGANDGAAAEWHPGPKTESSDHGYSTMTDRNNDDSEMGTTIGTILPIQRRNRSLADEQPLLLTADSAALLVRPPFNDANLTLLERPTSGVTIITEAQVHHSDFSNTSAECAG